MVAKDLREIFLSRKAEKEGIAASIPTDDNTAREEKIRKDLLVFAAGVIIGFYAYWVY